ncbi:MAG: DUF1592 domain-containing protein [Planctomycetota bacterium]
MNRHATTTVFLFLTTVLGLGSPLHVTAQDRVLLARSIDDFVQSYCVSCHNEVDQEAGLDLESASLEQERWWSSEDAQKRGSLEEDPLKKWEWIYKRVASRQMPPPDADRPSDQEFQAFTRELADCLDGVAKQYPRAARVARLRRLTRIEYQNSIRDLLDVTVDAAKWLPKDESSGGFDNITVGELSPVLMSRYLSAAQRIARTTVGRARGVPDGITVRLPADLTQEKHMEGLPLGTRGGVQFEHTFAESGRYRLSVRLTRDRDEMIEGLYRAHDLDVLIDGKPHHRFSIQPAGKSKDDTLIDANLNVDLDLSSGPHAIAVTFVDQGLSLLEIKRQPFDAAYNRHRHPRQQPAVFEVSVVGPLRTETHTGGGTEDAGDRHPHTPQIDTNLASTPSRRRVFTVHPKSGSLEHQIEAARQSLLHLARFAFRRDVTDEDIDVALDLFRSTIRDPSNAHSEQTASVVAMGAWQNRYQLGMEIALASILVNPHFLFRVESDWHPDGNRAKTPETPRPLRDAELAARLAGFLWSGLPDAGLLDRASAGELRDPNVLRREVSRMLADPRADSLVTNFASQWLYLRNLAGVTPDLRRFPDFDANLRAAFVQETQRLFEHVMRADRSVMELIDSPFTFLNERLAIHYGMSDVRGSHFRRVDLPAGSNRGGLLRHGSVLTVTSYATRTSPTIRGNWVLENILGTPPPPPPPDVPEIERKSTEHADSFRDLLAAHRENPACASCHALIDPVGFALDHYDALGRFRRFDGNETVDASGVLPDGTIVDGVADLEAAVLANPELFVSCLAEKLLTFALGRTVDHRDAVTIRSIVSASREDNYRFASLIQAIVASPTFLQR